MRIAIVVYDGMTALDAVGPYDILNRLPDTEVSTVGVGAGPKRAEGGLGVVAAQDLSAVTAADVVLVPGGGKLGAVMRSERLHEWLRDRHATAAWTASVCTGALVLGAAGLLDGRRVTTHWRAREHLARFGATFVDERVVVDGSLVTGGGVTAGIDLALTLARLLHGDDIARAVQLSAHYDPQPPFPPVHPDAAAEETLVIVRDRLGPR
jgi:transcriptional regulator GlxA family with amidase domain